MEIKENNNNSISFQKSDKQNLLELLIELEILDKKGLYQEGSLEMLGILTDEPDSLLTDFLSQPQDILYSKSDIEKNKALSLWDLYKGTNDTQNSSFQITGSSVFHFLGFNSLINQLKKLKIKKNKQLLWDALPLSIQNDLKECCKKRGNDLDVRIQKNDQKDNNPLTKVEQFLIKKLKPTSEEFFIQNFYTNRIIVSQENTFWTIQSFYYGNCTVDWCQFVKAPRTYRFIKEALLLEVDLDNKKVELKTKNPLILIQSLLDVILKISHSDLKNLLEDNDLGMLAYHQSCFHTCLREEDEENLIKQVFQNKEDKTAKLEKIIKTTHKKHSNKNSSLLVCLLLNSLRICAPYIDEEKLVNAMHQELSSCEKKSHIHTLCEMLLNKIEFEKISSLVQVVAFAALFHKVSIDKKKICMVQHRQVEHLQIGNEHSILLKWDIHKALKVVAENFNSLSPYFSNCLLNLIEPLNLSEREIFFIAAHEAKEFELASREFSQLNKKSKALLGRVFSNPQIPLKEKKLYLPIGFSLKRDEEQLSALLMDLNCMFEKCETITDTSALPDSIIEQILKKKECYPHLIRAIPLRKIHLVWQKEFQDIKDDHNKLLFFIQAIEFYHHFKIPHQLDAVTFSNPSNSEPFLKIDSKNSYIHTLCEMLLKSIDLEKISAALQIAFFVSMYEASSLSTSHNPSHKFEAIQIGQGSIFLKCDVKKAIKIVESHFELLYDFLPQFIEKPSLSPEEILFISAHEAKEINCALKMCKRIKTSVRNLERFLSYSNISKSQKISYLLGVLKLKNPSSNISFELSTLNTLLMQAKKNAHHLDLETWCTKFIWEHPQEYPNIFIQLPEKAIKEYCKTEFELIKNLKDQFNYISEKINFYKNQNISINFQDLTVPLYVSLMKDPKYSNEAKQLRLFYKNNKEVLDKMPQETNLDQKEQKETTGSIKDKNFTEILELIQKTKSQQNKIQLCKDSDQCLSEQLSEMKEASLQELNWQTLKQFLKNLPQTTKVLDEKINKLSLIASSLKEIELLQYHSKQIEILFQAANRLKENPILSKKCFELILKTPHTPLKEQINLIDFFSAYKDEQSLLWLLKSLPSISKSFSLIKTEELLKALDEVAQKLTSSYTDTHEKIQNFLVILLSNDIWTPFLSKIFTTYYVKLKKEDGLFSEPKKEARYQNLLKSISYSDLLQLLPLCVTRKEPSDQNAFYFIERLKTLLKNQPLLKDEPSFSDMEKTLSQYFLKSCATFLKEGASKQNWISLLKIISEASTLPLNLRKLSDSIISNLLFHLTLFEKDKDSSNEIYMHYLKNRSAQETATFLNNQLSYIATYLKNTELKNSMALYQKANTTHSLPPTKKTTPKSNIWNKQELEQINTLLKDEKFCNLIQFKDQSFILDCDPTFDLHLKIFYLVLKDILVSLIGKKDIHLSSCLQLALNWALTQFKIGDKSALFELNDINKALFNRIEKANLKKEEKEILAKLIYINKTTQKQNKKTYIESKAEGLFLNSLTEDDENLYTFYLIHEISLFKNSFSHYFIFNFLQESTPAHVKVLKHLVPEDWIKQNRLQLIQTWMIQEALTKKFKTPLHVGIILTSVSTSQLRNAFKDYIKLETYDESLQANLLKLKNRIDTTMLEVLNCKSTKETGFTNEQFTAIIRLYYDETEMIFLAFESENHLKLFNYSCINFTEEVFKTFYLLCRSRLRTLVPELWKELVTGWQRFPKQLLRKHPEYSESQGFNAMYSLSLNFIRCLCSNNIEIVDEDLLKIYETSSEEIKNKIENNK